MEDHITNQVRVAESPWGRCPLWVLERGGSPVAVSVMVALHKWRNHETSDAFPKVSQIAEFVGVSERTTQRALRELEKLGAISVELRSRPDGSQTSNLITIFYEPPGVTPVSPPPDTGVTGGCQESQGGVTSVAPLEPDPKNINPENQGAVGDKPPPRAKAKQPRLLDPPPKPKNTNTAKQIRVGALFEALARIAGFSDAKNAPRSQRSHIAKLARELEEIGATPDQVASRARVYRQKHPTWDCTPAAVVKYWAALAPASPPAAVEAGKRLDPKDVVSAWMEEESAPW